VSACLKSFRGLKKGTYLQIEPLDFKEHQARLWLSKGLQLRRKRSLPDFSDRL
jgi:hypothetical protein